MSLRLKPWFATGIGFMALVLWACGALLVVSIGNLPPFEIQTFIFSLSFLVSFLKISYKRSWHQLTEVPKCMWFIGVLGIFFANLFFVSAFQYAPPEKVDLINYLWPVMVILFSPLLPNEILKKHQLCGALLAFLGVTVLLTNGKGFSGFELSHWKGYLLSFLNAFFWTIFILFNRKYKSIPNEMIGLYCGIGALLAFTAHCLFETFVLPSLEQLLYLCILGIFCQGMGYLFWDHGIKKGYYKLLCTLSYIAPILSMSLLVLFKFTETSQYLILSTLLVTLGGLIAIPRALCAKRSSTTVIASSSSTRASCS